MRLKALAWAGSWSLDLVWCGEVVVSRVDIRIKGSLKGGTCVWAPYSNKVGMRASLKHSSPGKWVESKNWIWRVRKTEPEAEAGSSPKVTVGLMRQRVGRLGECPRPRAWVAKKLQRVSSWFRHWGNEFLKCCCLHYSLISIPALWLKPFLWILFNISSLGLQTPLFELLALWIILTNITYFAQKWLLSPLACSCPSSMPVEAVTFM